MKILIVDDEAPARERLRRLLGQTGAHECVGEASNGLEALRLGEKLKPDLVLLDIRMPGMDGLAVAKQFAQHPGGPAVVFTTAYDQFALDAFETNARHYLLKPVRLEKLRVALARVEAALNEHRTVGFDAHAQLRVNHHGAIKLIAVAKVLYFRADQKYTQVRTASESYLIDDSLLQLEERFAELFIRVHRGVLINRRRILALDASSAGHRVRLAELDETLEVSRRHLPAIRELFKPAE